MLFRSSDIPEYRDLTARMHVANLDFILKRPDVMQRFLLAYSEVLDWMFSGDEPLEAFARFYDLPVGETRWTRDNLYSRQGLDLKRLGGFDVAMKEALELKFISRPFTQAEIDEVLKYYIR